MVQRLEKYINKQAVSEVADLVKTPAPESEALQDQDPARVRLSRRRSLFLVGPSYL